MAAIARSEGYLASNVPAVCAAQFFQVVASNFGYVILPFYIRQVSTLPSDRTVVWTGWIMGAQGLMLVFSAPFWSRLSARVSPKLLYQRSIFANMLNLAVLPFVSDLRLLLAVQLISGLFSGASMLGVILIAASSPPSRLQADIGLFQGCQTAGQVLGPLLGSFSATLLGLRWSFLLGAAGVAGALAYAQWAIVDRRMPPRSAELGRMVLPWVAAAVGLMVVATMQLVFLPSLLPYVLGDMGVTGNAAVRAAGLIVLAYSATAALGAYLGGRYAERLGFLRSLLLGAGACCLLLWALTWASNPWSFGLIRALQTCAVAGIFPIVLGRAARSAGPGTLGILVSSRWAGQSVAAVFGTATYARWGVAAVFHLLVLATVVCTAVFAGAHYRLSERRAVAPRGAGSRDGPGRSGSPR